MQLFKSRKSTKGTKRILSIILTITLFFTLISNLSIVARAADENDMTNSSDIVRNLKVTYKLMGDDTVYPYNEGDKIADITQIQSFSASYDFAITDHLDSPNIRNIKGGHYYLIDLPDELIVSAQSMPSTIKNQDGVIIATIEPLKSVNSSQIKVTFSDLLNDMDTFDIHGNFSFDFSIDASDIEAGSSKIISMSIDNKKKIDIDVAKPEVIPAYPTSLLKNVASYSADTRELIWSVDISPSNGVFSGCTFSDTLDPNTMILQGIKHGTTELVENVDYTYDKTTGEVSYTIPSNRNGEEFKTIYLITKVKSDIYLQFDETKIENKAKLTGGSNNVNLVSNIATQKIKPNWINKTGSKIEGNKIQWEINVNNDNQKITNTVITDYLNSDLLLDTSSVTVDGTTINVYTGSHTPATDKEVYAVYDSTLKIFLPRGDANVSTASHKITLVTSVKSSSSDSSSTEYTNEADLTTDYIGDVGKEVINTPIVTDGVGIPTVAIQKNALEFDANCKKDGTIIWKITTVSNCSDYGYSRIVDTLPINPYTEEPEADFILDEIYLGSMTPENKINSTTTPVSAYIDDGKLIIDFNYPNALSTEKTIYVKTKLKTELYGNNLKNRLVTNDAEVTLYSDDSFADASILASDNDTGTIKITNNIIQKSTLPYTGNTTKNGENPRFNYEITINENLMDLKNVIVTDDLNQIKTFFNNKALTDLNGKWSLVKDSLSIEKVAGTGTDLDLNSIINNATYDADKNVITINFGEGVTVSNSYKITFTVELDITKDDAFKENGIISASGNKGKIMASNLKTIGVTSDPTNGRLTVHNDLLVKNGEYSKDDRQITWNINLNQHAINLTNPTVEDILPKGLTLDPTSIKLYKNVIAEDGSFIAPADLQSKATEVPINYKYEATEDSRYKLSVDLPDNSTSYILVFATDVDDSLLGTSISNEAYYSDKGGLKENLNSFNVNISSDGGYSSKKGSIVINKLNSDTNEPLEGALFRLIWLKNGTEEVPVRDLRTDANGQITFRGLALSAKYILREIEAPEGFSIDTDNSKTITVSTTGGPQEPLTFLNAPIKQGSYEFKATKHVEGTEQEKNSFKFEILDENDEVVMTGLNDTKLSNGDYSIKFTPKAGFEDILNFTDSHEFSGDETSYIVCTKNFKIREVEDSSMKGYEFDKNVHSIKLTVTNLRGEDTLKVTATDSNGNAVTDPINFTNSYSAKGSFEFTATKTLIGHRLPADKFTFNLYEEGKTEAIQTVNNLEGTDNNSKSTGNIPFNAINLTEKDAGTKVYIVTENLESTNPYKGYSYDSSKFKITLQVRDDKQGNMVVDSYKIEKTTDGVTFTEVDEINFKNTYSVEDVSIELKANKTLEGRALEENQFQFNLTKTNLLPDEIGLIATAKNDSNGNITFPKLSFNLDDAGKTFIYEISEANYNKDGYTCDKSIYKVTIDVIDNNDGTLSTNTTITKIKDAEGKDVNVVLQDNEIPTFTNNYHAEGSLSIMANKILTGHALTEGQFTFKLYEDGKDEPIQTVTNAAGVKNNGFYSANINFDDISYTEKDAGTKVYRLMEEVPAINPKNGYLYDNTQYVITVTVTDNGEGTMVTNIDSVKSTTDGVNYVDANALEFKNSYSVNDTSLQLNATKALIGKNLQDSQFNFTLEEVSDNPNAFKQTVSNSASGTITFDEITYGQEDIGKTFIYNLSEDENNKTGYTLDKSVYEVKVVVSDNNDGTISTNTTITKIKDANGNDINVVLKDNELPSFTNNYEATGKYIFDVTKNLTGHALAEGQFKFELYEDGNTTPLQTISNSKGIPILGNSFSSSFSFAPIEFTQADIGYKNYTIKEVVPSTNPKNGYSYDISEYKITLKIEDNDDGTLSVTNYKSTNINKENNTETEANYIIFYNNYSVQDISLSFKANKTLTNKTLDNEEFLFNLKETTEDNNNYDETVANNANGDIIFPDIYYTQSDAGKTFTYELSEVTNSKDYYTFDKSLYKITVVVTDNNNGALIASTTITKIKDAEGKDVNVVLQDNEIPTFNNGYSAKGELSLTATKNLTGHALKEGQFTFKLYEDGKDEPIETVTNATGVEKDGFYSANINFNDINYTEKDAGTKVYRLVEEVPSVNSKDGYLYDTTEYVITVSVADNKEGTMVTNIDSIQKTTDGVNYVDADSLEFNNTYSVKDASIEINANKTLTGKDAKANQFNFTLKEVSASDALYESTVSNDANGNIKFSGLTYDQEDIGKTFIYNLSEIDNNKAGYTFDKSVYEVKVVVIDNNDGTLSTPVTITKIKDAEGKDVNVVLGDKDIPKFVNNYAATGSYSFTGVKNLTGHALVDGQFKFELYEAGAETPLQVVSNSSSISLDNHIWASEIKFAPIEYDLSDVGSKTYIIKEVVPDNNPEKGYKYDTAEYMITLNIEDNDDGTLKVSVDNMQKLDKTVGSEENVEAIEFNNEYSTSDTNIEFNATKILKGKDLVTDEFKFICKYLGAKFPIVNTDSNEVSEEFVEDYVGGYTFPKEAIAYNDKDGKISFNEYKFTQEDIGKTFIFELSEEDLGKENYIYDSTVYKIAVKVVDNNDGTIGTEVSVLKVTDSEEIPVELDDIVFTNNYQEKPVVSDISSSSSSASMKTGDSSPVFPVSLLMLSSLAIIILARKKTS